MVFIVLSVKFLPEMPRQRLDNWLVAAGKVTSRAEARRLIMTGKVDIRGRKALKAGELIDPDRDGETLVMRGASHNFVSRGGLKLEKAIKSFEIDLKNIVALDMGASTGGFSDVMLRNGAETVFAVDVGYGVLDWKIRSDNRVVVIERFNVRELTPEILFNKSADRNINDFNGKVDFVTADLSFIGLVKVMHVISSMMKEQASAVLLVKPQFEAGRAHVGKGGIVRDPESRGLALKKTLTSALENGLVPAGIVPSPITGAEGNVEYLMYLKKNGIPDRKTISLLEGYSDEN